MVFLYGNPINNIGKLPIVPGHLMSRSFTTNFQETVLYGSNGPNRKEYRVNTVLVGEKGQIKLVIADERGREFVTKRMQFGKLVEGRFDPLERTVLELYRPDNRELEDYRPINANKMGISLYMVESYRGGLKLVDVYRIDPEKSTLPYGSSGQDESEDAGRSPLGATIVYVSLLNPANRSEAIIDKRLMTAAEIAESHKDAMAGLRRPADNRTNGDDGIGSVDALFRDRGEPPTDVLKSVVDEQGGM